MAEPVEISEPAETKPEDELDDVEAAGGADDAAKKKKKKKKKKGGGGEGGEEGGDGEAPVAAPAAEAAAADDADGDAEGEGGEGGDSAAKKKRDKKKAAAARKKAEAAAEDGGGGGGDGTVPIFSTQTEWSSLLRGINKWGAYPKPEKGGKPQRQGGEWGLAVPVLEQFPSGDVPHGWEVEYSGEHQKRITNAEKRELERLHNISYQEIRTAAECHRQVRKHMQSVIKPGMLMTDICEQLENLNRTLVQENGLKAGIAFPTGCSINHVAAHWTPNSGDKTVLQYAPTHPAREPR